MVRRADIQNKDKLEWVKQHAIGKNTTAEWEVPKSDNACKFAVDMIL